jgi:hypothetical protein
MALVRDSRVHGTGAIPFGVLGCDSPMDGHGLLSPMGSIAEGFHWDFSACCKRCSDQGVGKLTEFERVASHLA